MTSRIQVVGKTVDLPVRGVGVSVEVQQDIACVCLTQVFFNQTQNVLEVEYIFPIPVSAALSSLRIFTGGRVIEGKVKEKEAARAEYSDALASGSQAILGEISELSDVVTLHIGSLQPESEVTVEVAYVVESKFENERWRLFVPLLVIPRYQSSGIESAPSQPQTWAFKAILHLSSPIREASVNLPHSQRALDSQTLLFEGTDASLPAVDIEVSYSIENFSAPFFLAQRDAKTGMIGLHFSFQPPYSTASLEDFEPSGEFVILIDRSGSMGGGNIETAVEAAGYFIKSLPEQSLFNIVSFGSNFTKLFNESQVYSKASIDQAISALKTFKADMGGTEIFKPIESVLKSPPNSSFPRYVFVLTDGQVYNVEDIVELVKKNHANTRVSTIGIGTGASTALIERVAEAGKGTSTLILDLSQIRAGVLRALERAIQPSLNGINIEFLSGTPICVSPSEPFYAFNGDRVSFNAILSGGPAAFRVSYTDSQDSELKTFDFTDDLSNLSEGRLAIVQAVRASTGTPNEIQLAESYNVLTKNTSLIAVCPQEGTSKLAPHRIKAKVQPISSPAMPKRIYRAYSYGRSSGKGLGKVGAKKRCRKLARQAIGINKPSICRLARRGGVKRLSGLVYEETQTILKYFLENVIRDAVVYTSYGRRKTVTALDVLYALKLQGRSLYLGEAMPQVTSKARRKADKTPSISQAAPENTSLKNESKPKRTPLLKPQKADFTSPLTHQTEAHNNDLHYITEITSLQNPDGSWSSSVYLNQLLRELGIEWAEALGKSSPDSPEILATSLVCNLLRTRYPEFEDTWRLIVHKGVRWLKRQKSSIDSQASS